ncbi:polyribonucleotide nucleotidyltransferase [Aliarcobacter thereius]|uniref:Polyribonucleotide nucleotidyltransferase n=1 Tax=Aliarcobacter thereius TaxID=544718 RepID=A0A5R9H1A6_9BACT|nr:polyribonucleotide nucleotidyltransferase [Aliarcobacter thereius]TLS71911.1 polyribonucleotide nucleotidyltransferase [Aliarcobacter thereius]
MAIICEIDLNNQKEIFEFDKVAKQANGSVLAKVGDCVVLAAVACEFDNPVSEDFTPLTVQYIEKTYASAKLPGGFIKREAKPSDFETLTSRVIDRSLRPLFPKGFVYPTTITVMVLSADKDVDLQTIALNAANAALYTSNLPIKKSVCGVRVGKIDDKLVLNPNQEDLTNSTLDLYIAGSKDELLMIEMKSSSSLKDKEHCANEMNEEDLLKAISFAQEALKKANIKYEENFEKASKERVNIELIEFTIDEKIISYVRDNFSNDVKDAIKKLAKSERATELKELAKKISQNEYCTSNEIENSTIYEAVNIVKRELVRAMIVDDKVRADGRGLKDVRPISIETNILPKAHSSCLFTRGETQALVVGTIAGAKDGQMYEVLTDKATSMENFMVHYNFPGFSVGEAKPIFGVGRRELGHGNLAKKALEATISKNYNETVRLVSEILESNGSSSMATVCGGSLALKAAKIPISDLVAGVAMGMVVEDDKYSILTDIMGLEDHDGDMDFKVAGTKNGITALQMDIKLGGIELSVLTEALNQAKEGRLHILNIMEDASKDIVSSKALPKCEEFEIDSSKMMIVIGKGGSTIKEIIEKYSVNIDLDRDNGIVKVSGEDENKIFDACEFIKNLVNNSSSSKPQVKNIDFEKLYSIDEKVSGKVERVVDFGAFISLEKGGEGLLHISKISKDRIEKASDVLSVGQELEVKVLKVQKDRIELGLN